ncbi:MULTISPECIES: gliding motility-associated C-terminal domain-containing protein [unclassified Myroides]|uniref:T9SS type B sorting domain-containing protein n=1 Tax=unclassified Myroides TaxID=2642485 RepID=UPI003D2F8F4A
MLNKRISWIGIVLVVLPVLAFASTSLSWWIPEQGNKQVVQSNTALAYDQTLRSLLVFEDNFENNAAGWSFSNSTVNQWFSGFPEDFLAEGEESVGLYVSKGADTFAYVNDEAAVSHAYKSFQLPSGIDKVRVHFDWVSGGYSIFDEERGELIGRDYLQVWLVPQAFVPTANVPITAENSQGMKISPFAYFENSWMVQRENALVELGPLAGTPVKIVLEWVNQGEGLGTVPAAVRALSIAAIDCGVIDQLPFVEDFSFESLSRDCWTRVANNEGNATWEFSELMVEGGLQPDYFMPVAMIDRSGSGGVNDDWLITPTVKLTGNQQLVYSYKAGAVIEGDPFRILYSNTGAAVTQFTHTLVPVANYNSLVFTEEVVPLVDEEGNPLIGDITLAWHIPSGGNQGGLVSIANVRIEDIPACELPRNLVVREVDADSATIAWTASESSLQWEVAVLPVGSDVPEDGVAVERPEFVAEGLENDAIYEVYVRTKCTTATGDVFSSWAGPVSFRTTLVPVALPYVEDFEDEPLFGWSNDAINTWIIGEAVNNGGTHALYITDDGGLSNHYDRYQRQVSHVFKDLIIPEGASDLAVALDWRNRGEANTDQFKIWLVPISYVPVAGRELRGDDRHIQLGQELSFTDSNVFVSSEVRADIRTFAGQQARLIFEWINLGFSGNQPPAVVDNLVVKTANCPQPFGTSATEITQNGAEISWDPADGVTNYDVYVATTAVPPLDTTTPTHANVTSSLALTDLQANTRYYVWVRARCGDGTTGFWIEPIHFITKQVPADLPFTDGFEDGMDWSVDVGQINAWTRGGAIANQGTQAVYISENQGQNYAYNVQEASVSHVYRDIVVPVDAEELTLTFDWMAEGEISRNNPKDYFRVLKVPNSTVPTGGEVLPVNETHVLVGQPYYGASFDWKTAAAVIDVRENQGEVIRVVFEWINQEEGGLQPPAAIDNVRVSVSTCLSVKNPIAERVSHTNAMRLSWTPQGNETKWEVFTTLQGNPAPDAATPGIVVEGDPHLVLEDVEEGQYFVYYVRAICEAIEGDDKAIWVGPTLYSYFIPPVCIDLEGGIEGTPTNESNTYVICEQGPVTKKLNVSYFNSKRTNMYKVEAIEYNPPFPFIGGDMVDLTIDDEWSKRIALGFDFCFFDQSYNSVLISTNGAITFSIADEVEGGRYQPESFSSWFFDQPIPFASEEENAPFLNAIFGVMQDLDPSASPDDFSINYQILGTYPCRALVFNIYHMGLYDRYYDINDIEGSTQTSQIVLYEGTNSIDVYVKNRPTVPVPVNPEANPRHNNGNGLIGIQNGEGTLAYTPENRNTGDWTASNEAWRFTPDGESTVDFKWYKDNVFYSADAEIEVEVTESTTYTARATYAMCEGDDLVVERVFKFVKEDFPAIELPDVYACGSTSDPDNKVQIELTEQRELLGALLGEQSEAKFEVRFFENADLTGEIQGPLTVETRQTVYVELLNKLTHCTQILTFDAVRIAPIVVTQLPAITACESYVLPTLAEGERYFSQPTGKGIAYEAGDLYEVLGTSTLYIYKSEDGSSCYGESVVHLTIYEAAVADQIDNQNIQCERFFLPELSANNSYHTAPRGGGEVLQAGEEIIQPTTIYIYAQNGPNAVNCWDESSFVINFEACPIPKGFSPNGDGINDTFDLSNHGISKIQIFNRNGREVYAHGENYTNQFEGKDKNGNQLPAATYYYIVISHGKQRTGWVQINY